MWCGPCKASACAAPLDAQIYDGLYYSGGQTMAPVAAHSLRSPTQPRGTIALHNVTRQRAQLCRQHIAVHCVCHGLQNVQQCHYTAEAPARLSCSRFNRANITTIATASTQNTPAITAVTTELSVLLQPVEEHWRKAHQRRASHICMSERCESPNTICPCTNQCHGMRRAQVWVAAENVGVHAGLKLLRSRLGRDTRVACKVYQFPYPHMPVT